MGISRVAGQMLQSTLERDGVNLSVTDLANSTPVLFLDVNNGRVGVNTASPGTELVVVGNISATGNIISNTNFVGNGYYLTDINAGNILNSYGNANVAAYLPVYGGNIAVATISSNANVNIAISPGANGIVTIANTAGGASGIQLGPNTLGQFVSNALTLTSNTSVTNGIAELNQILGKLVPPAPPAFPNSTALSITSATTTARMANGFTQTDNTTTGNKAVAAGTVVSAVRSSTYATNTISTTGPGDSGTLAVYLNSVSSGNVTFNPLATPTANGVYSNLVVTNNQDYHASNASIPPGFWYVFSSSATGTVPQGWNEVYISDTAAGNTNTPVWYYDSSTAAAPVFSSTTFTACASPSLAYSSTVPHYTGNTYFNLGFNVNRLSANMYPNNGNLLTNSTTAGGAFLAPATVSYASANIAVPLVQNLYVASGNATANTTAYIVNTGFGNSTAGPTVTVTNSYNTTTNTFTPAGVVLYKNGNTTAIDEGNIVIGSNIGSGSGSAYRIVNPSGNTVADYPVYTGSEATFNSQTGPFYTTDATVTGVGSQGVLRFDKTNYSTGYLPAGPNLSAQQNTQYFTFKFVRTSVSKFNIQYVGTVAGMWVALPGSVFDTASGNVGPTSGLNGWLNMCVPYGGAGIPGSNGHGGNGSDGCALGGAVIPNTLQSNASTAFGYTCTFGTVNSSSTATNEIYVRIKLTSGQSVTALSLQTASN